MPEYQSPGVYIEEIKIGAAPIEGVSTSTAGMVGVTKKGSVKGLPELVTSFADYERKFGGFLDEAWGDARFLPFAVQGFFQNGGQRAYIKRVVGDNAKPSELMLPAGIVTCLAEDMDDTPSRRTSAILVSMRGICVGTKLTFKEKTGNPVDINVTSYNGNLVSWENPALPERGAIIDRKFTKAGTSVTVNGPVGSNTIKLIARDPGEWGNDIFVQIASVNTKFSPLAADVKIPILGIPLVFTAITPDNVTLDEASYRKVSQNDWIELRNNSGDKEQKKIIDIGSSTNRLIRWDTNIAEKGGGPLAHDYTTGTLTLRDITAISPEFENSGPANNVTKIKMKNVSKLQINDWVEFANPSKHQAEKKQITAIDYATQEISWSGNLTGNYNTTESKVTLFSYTIIVENTTGLLLFDRIRFRQGDSYDDAEIDNITGKNIRLKLIKSTGLSKVYTSGDMLESMTAARSGATSVKLKSVSNFYVGAVVEFDTGTIKEYRKITAIDNDLKIISWTTALTTMYLDGNQARICEFDLNLSYTPDKGTPIAESHKNLNMDADTNRYFKTIIDKDSKLVTVDDQKLTIIPPGNQPTTDTGLPVNLTAGNDGNPPKDKHYIGVDIGPGNRTGIKSLIDIDDISIVAVPGVTSQNVQNALIEHCEIATKDRFAVLDPDHGLDVEGIQAHRNLYDSHYAALYYPWIKALDPLEDKTINVPPSGHVIGIYARSDSQRGVHKAPANEVIQGITGIEVQINKGEQDILNPKGINAIRLFPGRGVRVWGARTVSSDSLWKYINIRRLFLYLEESLDKGTQWVVFEPNNEKLWGRVKATVNEFLTRVWRDGALMGLKAEEAFFVKCDRSTMTQDDIDNGRLIIMIGVAPVKPAEFVIIRIAQWAGGAAPKE